MRLKARLNVNSSFTTRSDCSSFHWNNGRIIITKDTDAMFELMNSVAPEHLEIAMDKAYDYLEKVENAGSVFLGHFT